MPAVTVSVVIPTYNRKSIIGQAVDCALAQTHQPLEVIVADDGSTDGTLDELRRRYPGESRLRLLECPHRRQAAARNAGIAVARGDLVALLDSDDYWYPEYLASQVAVLTGQGADMVIANGRRQYQDGTFHLLFEHPTWVVPDRVETLWRGTWMQPSFTVYRTEAARAVPYDETLRIGEDLEIMYRFLEAGYRCVGNPATLAEYRAATGHGVPTATQLTTDNDWLLIGMYRVWQMHADRYPQALDQGPEFDRTWGELMLRNGHWADARRHLWRLWRRNPLDRETARKLAHSLTRRRPPAAAPARAPAAPRTEVLRWLPEHTP